MSDAALESRISEWLTVAGDYDGCRHSPIRSCMQCRIDFWATRIRSICAAHDAALAAAAREGWDANGSAIPPIQRAIRRRIPADAQAWLKEHDERIQLEARLEECRFQRNRWNDRWTIDERIGELSAKLAALGKEKR